MVTFKENKRIYSCLLITLVLCLIGVIAWKTYSPSEIVAADDVPLVRTYKAHTDNSSQSFSYSGEVRGRYEIPLAFRISGKIISRSVDPGSNVKPGELLMQIDPGDVQLNVNAIEAQVNAAQSQLKLAGNNLERTQTLYDQGAVSKAALEQTQNFYDTAQGLYNQAIAQSQQAANQLAYCSLHAENTGIIAQVNAQAGQVIQAGSPVLIMVKDGDREIEINVPENRIENFREARKFKISFWALPDIIVDGQVREVAPVADPVARTFKVRITLLNPPPEIKLGMTSTVTVDGLDNEQAVVVIPLSAIYQTGNTPSVWIVSNDVVSLRKIKILGLGRDEVQITEGLNDGDLVVMGGVHKLMEGQKVRIGNTAL